MRRAYVGVTSGDDRGIASLEFILVLPFLWLILAFTLTFGQLYLERQRTNVALREMAIRHTTTMADAGDDAPMNPIAADLATDTLGSRRLVAQFFLDREPPGTCPGESPDLPGGWTSYLPEIPDAVIEIFRNLSSSHSYAVVTEGPPLIGRNVPRLFGLAPLSQPQHNACFAMDNNPWTVYDTGTPGEWLERQLGIVGKVAGAILGF